jgi:hypothetical protein
MELLQVFTQELAYQLTPCAEGDSAFQVRVEFEFRAGCEALGEGDFLFDRAVDSLGTCHD